MNLPPITIALTTYYPPKIGGKRWDAVRAVLQSWAKHLNYEGEMRAHVADDGSGGDYLERTVEIVSNIWGEPTVSVQTREGYGASLNKCFDHTEALAFHGVDDWLLRVPFDLTPWATLLYRAKYNIGMVRLGPPHPGLTGEVVMFEEGWYLRLNRHNFACGLRPSLWRRSFWEEYGPFREGISALESERLFNDRFCRGHGLEAALALPDAWQHMDTVSLSAMEPSDG